MWSKLFLFIFFSCSTLCWALGFDSSNDFSVSGNSYSGDFKYATKNQLFYDLSSNNKVIFNNKFDISISPEFFYLENLKIKNENKAVLLPKELSLNLYTRATTFKLGYFQLKKEGPDIFDPFSYQQPKNYIDPLHASNLPLLGLKTEYELNSHISFDLSYIPKNSVPIIPTNSSPWLPRENKFPIRSDSYIIDLPTDVQYDIIENKEDKYSVLQNNYIVKTKITTSAADFVLQFAETISDTPDVRPETLNATLVSASPVTELRLDNPVSLSVHWKKVKNYGAGVIVPFESLGLLTKLFLNEKISPDDKTDSLAFALEKTYKNFTFILEYSRQKIKYKEDNTNALTLTNLFENADALGIRYAPTDNFSVLMGGLFDNIKGSYLFYFKPKLFITQNFYTEVQYINIGGRKDSLLSNFEKNDAVSLKLGTVF